MRITLPDGSVKEFDSSPVTARQVAESIGAGLAKAAVGAKVDGTLTDLDRPITQDAELAIVTKPRKGPGDADALYLLRHSTAHVMAEAIQRLWPQAQLAYGPPLETGFYYDIALDTPISTDDFEKIEAEMKKIVEENRPFTRYELPPEDGMKRLGDEGNKYKIDNAQRAIDGGADVLSWYVTGEVDKNWEDLCMGPHVPATGYIGAFKVTSVAQSHWHGDIESDKFQRVYGTAFFSQADLDNYLEQLEQARQRDHRVIGAKLGLFAIDEQVGQGLILWKPKGAMVRSLLQDFLQQELLKRGYDVVYTPHIGKIDLYKTSGHYPYYSDSQFPPIKMRDSEEEYLLKPMNCPHHIKIFDSEPHSYRDLPIRLAEFGTVYRFEQSGELTGMTRVRGFTQDDAHIFCTQDQVKGEFRDTVELVQFVFNTFGFEDVSIRLSLRDPDSNKYAGDPANWDRAENELREVLADMGIPFTEAAGEAAFYGPKVDFIVRDVIGRPWQLGTVQLDYNLPDRFKIEYVDADNTRKQPVMIHRAPFGSMERFMAILIEHYAGAFPLWLAPEQVRVLPISEKFAGYAEQVVAGLKAAGLRTTLDNSNERVNAKIKVAQEQKVPYMLIVGGKDEAAGTVSVRERAAGDLGAIPLTQFIEQAKAEVESHGRQTVKV
ncbi:threonine--tRNA ligase [Planctomycetales bacterium ZRK34]|nr:threonine--tRNA ligase [Planctomycetales bacterium ZRK34]